METKNSEISSLVDEFTNASNDKDVNPLSMLLNGVIDAAVQGGTIQYKRVCNVICLYTCEVNNHFMMPLCVMYQTKTHN